MEEKLNMILRFVIAHKERININAHTIHEELFLKSINFSDAKQLFDIILKSQKVGVYRGQSIGYLAETESFLNKGGFSKNQEKENEKDLVEQKPTNLFLSYNWAESAIAEKIYNDLKQVGVNIIKDNHRLEYKDSIREFMHLIRTTDFAIVLISDNYLKSKNCIYELLQLFKEKDYKEKILPIIIDGTKIYSALDRVNYIRFWETKCTELKGDLDSIDIVNGLGIATELKLFTEIAQNIDGFLLEISDMLHIPLKTLQQDHYKPILEKVGYQDVSFLIHLIAVASSKNVEQRDILLDQYAKKYPLNTYYYSIKAATNTMAKKHEQARMNYLEAIRQNSENIEALNNIGLIYNDILKDKVEAIKYFRRAVEVDPKFTIAQLNLAFVLSRSDSKEEAVRIYKKILTYDPFEAKAHNNLGDHYKHEDFKGNFELSKSYFLRAIELKPDYVDPYIGYANLLKLNKQIDEGNKYYRKALKIDTGYFKPFIKAALKTDKA